MSSCRTPVHALAVGASTRAAAIWQFLVGKVHRRATAKETPGGQVSGEPQRPMTAANVIPLRPVLPEPAALRERARLHAANCADDGALPPSGS
jgi:hypothetical protein